MEDDNSESKKCPFCAEVIKREAIKCRFCGSMLTGTVDRAGGEVVAGNSRSSFDLVGLLLITIPAAAACLLGILLIFVEPAVVGRITRLLLLSVAIAETIVVGIDRFRAVRRKTTTNSTRGSLFWSLATLLVWVLGVPAYAYARKSGRDVGTILRTGAAAATSLLLIGLSAYAFELPSWEAAKAAEREKAAAFHKLMDLAQSPPCNVNGLRACEGQHARELLECAADHFIDLPQACAEILGGELLMFFADTPHAIPVRQTLSATREIVREPRAPEPVMSLPGGVVRAPDGSFGLRLVSVKKKRTLVAGDAYVTRSQGAGAGWSWVIAKAAVENSLGTSQAFLLSRFGLRDSDGRTYDPDDEAGMLFFSAGVVETVHPGTSSTVVLVYRIPDVVRSIGIVDKATGMLALQP